MDTDNKISNDFLIIAKNTGHANDVQIKTVLDYLLDKANLKSNVYVNVVYNKKEPCNYAYIWVANKEAAKFLTEFEDNGFNYVKQYITVHNPEYDAYMNKNPNRKPLYEKKMIDVRNPDYEAYMNKDPNRKPLYEKVKVEVPNPEYESYLEKDETFKDPEDFILKASKKGSISWADEMDVAPPPTIHVIKDVEVCPPIIVQREIDVEISPPTTIQQVQNGEKIDMIPIKYTNDQLDNMKKKNINNDSDDNDGYDSDMETEVYITLHRAFAKDFTKSNTTLFNSTGSSEIDEDDVERRIYNKWIAKNIADDITFEILHKKLRCFVTDPHAKGKLSETSTSKVVNYPHINFTKNKDGKRSVFVTWNPNSTDGILSLQMCRQLKLKCAGGERILYFNYLENYKNDKGRVITNKFHQ